MAKEKTTVTVKDIVGWVLAGLFVIMMIGLLGGKSYVSALFMFLAVIIVLPYTYNLLQRKLSFQFSTGVRVLAILVLVIFSILSTPSSTTSTSSKSEQTTHTIVTEKTSLLVPQDNEVPTEWTLGEISTSQSANSSDHTAPAESSSRSLFLAEGFSGTSVTVSVSKYETEENAKKRYLLAVNESKARRGYTDITDEINVKANCFGKKIPYAGVHIICQKYNIVFFVDGNERYGVEWTRRTDNKIDAFLSTSSE